MPNSVHRRSDRRFRSRLVSTATMLALPAFLGYALGPAISTSACRTSAASGPSKSRQCARSPALPARSSAAAAAPTPVAPTACAAPLSLCAAAATFAKLPVREATSISRSASIAVSRNFPNSASMAARSSPSHAPSTFRSIAAVGSFWSGRSPTLLSAWTGSQRSRVARRRSMLTGFTR